MYVLVQTKGWMKAIVYAGMVVGLFYSIGDWLSLVGWVLALLFSAMYFRVEDLACSAANLLVAAYNHSKNNDLEINGTIATNDSLTKDETKRSD